MSTKKRSASATQESPAEFSLISNETLLALHHNLLKCRARQRGPKRFRGTPQSAAEYDAVVVAVTNCLVGGDYVRSTARAEVIDALRGQPNIAARRPLSTGPGLAAMLQGALGAALANKTGKTGKVTIVFGACGNRDAWRHALEAARAHGLPIVFLGTIDLSKERRNHAVLKSRLSPGTELPQITVDGNDAVAIYRVAHEAIDRARRDRGPTLIECAEYRLRGRSQNDPIANMEAYLKGKGLLPLALNRRPAAPKSRQRRAR